MARLTKVEINEAFERLNESLYGGYRDTAEKDIKQGYRDRMAGYYDKWFRYNRADEGAAYDRGVGIATTREKCPEYMRIIPA